MRKKWVERISGILAIVVVIVFVSKSVGVLRVIKNLEAQITYTEKEITYNEKLLEELKAEREAMESLEYIEKMAREKLGMVKKDDIVFRTK
jgi:cell division protein DivIC